MRYASSKWDIQGVHFVRSNEGWARVRSSACAGGTSPCPAHLWYTSDGGARWKEAVAYGRTDAVSLYALNTRDVWVVSLAHAPANGTCSLSPCTLQIFATTDGGRKWTEEYDTRSRAAKRAGNAVAGLTAREGKDGKLEAWMFLSNGLVLALRSRGWRVVGQITQGVPALGLPNSGGPHGQTMQFLNGQDGWLAFCDLGTAAADTSITYTAPQTEGAPGSRCSIPAVRASGSR